jgi:hypothetical protein
VGTGEITVVWIDINTKAKKNMTLEHGAGREYGASGRRDVGL